MSFFRVWVMKPSECLFDPIISSATTGVDFCARARTPIAHDRSLISIDRSRKSHRTGDVPSSTIYETSSTYRIHMSRCSGRQANLLTALQEMRATIA